MNAILVLFFFSFFFHWKSWSCEDTNNTRNNDELPNLQIFIGILFNWLNHGAETTDNICAHSISIFSFHTSFSYSSASIHRRVINHIRWQSFFFWHSDRRRPGICHTQGPEIIIINCYETKGRDGSEKRQMRNGKMLHRKLFIFYLRINLTNSFSFALL